MGQEECRWGKGELRRGQQRRVGAGERACVGKAAQGARIQGATTTTRTATTKQQQQHQPQQQQQQQQQPQHQQHQQPSQQHNVNSFGWSRHLWPNKGQTSSPSSCEVSEPGRAAGFCDRVSCLLEVEGAFPHVCSTATRACQWLAFGVLELEVAFPVCSSNHDWKDSSGSPASSQLCLNSASESSSVPMASSHEKVKA